MSNLYLEVQQALVAGGYPPGPIDGIWGPRSRLALTSFQRNNGLTPDGVPGAATLSKLLGRVPDLPIPWLDEATRLMGLREGVGSQDNPVILDWARDLDLLYPHDSVAWCGLFIAHTIRSALPNEPLPANPLGARAYEKFGLNCAPQVGSVGVFWRVKPQSGLGHVGYLIGQRSDAYLVRGGNQSDSVRDAWVSKSRFLSSHWPVTGGPPQGKVLPEGGPGSLSVNES